MSETFITSNNPKGLQSISLFRAIYDKKRLTPERAQLLNERGGEFQEGISKLIDELTVSNQFADEEVKSEYAYPKEYSAKPIKDQIFKIAEIFGLDPASALAYADKLPQLPEGAENWFAVPSVAAIASKYFPEVTDEAEKYCRSIQLVHKKINASRKFYNYHEGEITPDHLRIYAHTAHALDLIAEEQKGDILIIAAQLGMRHRGRSVRRARAVFSSNEFGLGSLIVGAIALVNPGHFVKYDELRIDCAGDMFKSGKYDDISGSPGFYCFDDQVRFGARFDGNDHDGSGSASGFLI